MNKHQPYDLKQMQSLPLEAKIIMTKQRIKAWYESWDRYEIYNKETGKTRFVTLALQPFEEPPMKESEYVQSVYGGQVYVSWSGGKDSTVLKHIVDSMYDDVPAVFVNTGLEYPELQRFVKDAKEGKFDCFNTDIEIVRPEMRFDEVIKKYGYPVASKEVSSAVGESKRSLALGNTETIRYKQLCGTLLNEKGEPSMFNKTKWKFLLDAPFNCSDKCCDVMKKKPAKKYGKQTGRKPIIATMADESRLRLKNWMKYGCNAFEKNNPSSNPMSFWTEQDVLHYIKKYNVPYASVYGDIVVDVKVDGDNVLEGQMNLIDYLGCYDKDDLLKTTGCDRTGCMFCMFGCHLEKEPNRFQRMKKTHPRQYEYCMKPVEEGGLGLKEVLEYINVPYQ